MVELAPTRSTVLALREERTFVRQGHEFLDEKRMLLASEVMRQLAVYESLYGRYIETQHNAIEALIGATDRHGLEGLWLYPAVSLDAASLTMENWQFLGLPLVKVEFERGQSAESRPPADPSPEARRCTAAFGDLLDIAVSLAGVSANLRRLAHEYQRTERRARALEEIILPELNETVRVIEDHLETADQEEIIRVRHIFRSMP